MRALRALPKVGLVLLLLLAPAIALAQSAAPQAIEVVGAKTPASLTFEALAALPQVEQTVTFQTKNGPETAVYKGPLLWDVIAAAKALEGLERNHELARTLSVHAVDGYEIAFSIGEIAPEFGNAMILLALETDGHKLKDGFRIVAQGDKRGARAIHNVTRIELK